MSLTKTLSHVCDQLQDSLVQLAEGIPSEGMSPAVFRDLISGLKDCLNSAGRVSLQTFIMAHEEHATLYEHGGKHHRFKSVGKKTWLTAFGPLHLSRRYFQPDRGGEGIIPIDMRCGMKGRYMTPDLEEACALGASLLVPREVETFLQKVLPSAPSTTAVGRVIEDVGGYAESHADEIEAVVREQAALSDTGSMLVASLDGVTVPLREEGKKMGRPSERPGLDLSTQSRTAWREAGVGTVSIYKHATLDARPERLDARYMARMPESGMKTLCSQMEGLVTDLRAKRGFESVVVICDGKPSIWNWAENADCFEGATFILDFYHAAEHISHAAEAIFGKNSEEGRRWYRKYRARLKEDGDGLASLVRSLRYYGRKARRGSDRRKTIYREARYFSKNKHRMNYAEFLLRGLPIGSGPVEAACKTVVGARLKRSGMRWNRDGGQRVLNMRIQHLSKRWNTFWEAYMGDRLAA